MYLETKKMVEVEGCAGIYTIMGMRSQGYFEKMLHGRKKAVKYLPHSELAPRGYIYCFTVLLVSAKRLGRTPKK